MSTDISREAAETRVDRGFLIHLAVFAVVGGTLLAIDLGRNPQTQWPHWVLGGWGLGVLVHAACTHLLPQARERMINRTAARTERREAKL